MEKQLSDLLKLVISDYHLVRKFYHDDAIITANQAFILCEQLAGLSVIDFRCVNSLSFSYGFKFIYLVFVLNKTVQCLPLCYSVV